MITLSQQVVTVIVDQSKAVIRTSVYDPITPTWHPFITVHILQWFKFESRCKKRYVAFSKLEHFGHLTLFIFVMKSIVCVELIIRVELFELVFLDHFDG